MADPLLDIGIIDTSKADPLLEVGVVDEAEEDEGVISFISELITGKKRETEATRTLPEIGGVDTGAGALGDLQIAGGLLTTLNPEAQKDIIKSAVPSAFFEEDERGNVIVGFPQEDGTVNKAILNKPGASFQDLVQLSAQVLSYVPATKLAGLANGLMRRMGLAGFGAGVTDIALQTAAGVLGSEQELDPTQTAIATALGPVGEVIGGGRQAISNIRRARATGAAEEEFEEVLPSVIEAQEAVEGLARISPTGERVGLTQPQQTLVPSQLAQQRAVAEIPAGARVAKKTLEQQNIEISNALDNVLETISDPLAIERGAEGFKAAAQKAIDNAVTARTRITKPMYEEAITAFDAAGEVVPLEGVRGVVGSIKEGAASGSTSEKAMNRVLGLLKGADDTPPTMRQLHDAKLEIDSMIQGVGHRPVSSTVQGQLLEVKDALIGAMDEVNPNYKAASEAFAELSKPIDEIVGSRVGQAARKDELKNLSSIIFDAQEINPQVMRNVKQVIQSVNPQAWDDLLRLHIEKRLGRVRGDKIGAVANRPKEVLDAVFGPNENQARIILSAASDEQRQNLIWLRKVARRAQQGRPGGSDTAAKLQAQEARSVNRILGLFRPLEAIGDIGREEAQAIADRKLAKMLFDTKFTTKMKKLRKLDLDSPELLRAVTQIFDDIGDEE